MSSCKNPLVADNGASADMSPTRQLDVQADLPWPFTRGRVCPSNDPNSSCRMLHTHYRNNSNLCLKIIYTQQWKTKMRPLLIPELGPIYCKEGDTWYILIPLRFMIINSVKTKFTVLLLVFTKCKSGVKSVKPCLFYTKEVLLTSAGFFFT